MDKKNFCINGIKYSIVVGYKNYLEYYHYYKTSTIEVRKRVYKGFGATNDFEVLEQIAIKFFAEMHNKTVQQFLPQSKLHEYLEDNRYRFKPRSWTQFLGVTNRFVNYCRERKIKPEKITYSEASKFVAFLSNTRQNGTIFNNILVLKSIFNGMIKTGTVKENVFTQLPKVKRAPMSLMFFNQRQISDITNYTKQHDRQLYRAIILLYSCGIRPAELITLKLYNINLEDALIEIEAGNAKNSKTQKVVIPDYVLNELKFIDQYPNHYFLFSREGCPGATKLGDNFLNNKHRAVLRQLKINGRYALYSWKHTGAVAMVKCGINIKQIQIQLRHSSLDMTNEYLKNLGVDDNKDLKHRLPPI